MSIQFWGEGSGGGPLGGVGRGYLLTPIASGVEAGVDSDGSGGCKPRFAGMSVMGMARESTFLYRCGKLSPVPNMVMVVRGKGV